MAGNRSPSKPGADGASPKPPVPSSSADVSSDAANANAGQIVTWVLVPLLGLGSTFMAERRRGTMRRILASPANRIAVVGGTAAAEVVAALAQIALLVGFGAVAFALPWLSHPAELAVLSIAFCIAGASLGALLGQFSRTERQAGSMGLVAAMVLAVLGGCWYPASRFPTSMQAVARLNPAGWAMDGFLAALSPASGAGPALRDAAFLALFSAVVLLIAILAGRLRRPAAA